VLLPMGKEEEGVTEEEGVAEEEEEEEEVSHDSITKGVYRVVPIGVL